MKNYRIAFFTADWNYELVESTLHGLKRFVDDHPNVNLCIFDCFGKDTLNARNRSEYAVFDLADLKRFDGLLVQGNQLVLRQVRDSIAARVAKTHIPAVTIDCPIEGCKLVGIDNQQAQKELVDHVIREHGARKLVYLTGIMQNGCPEGKQRRDGFLDACRENGVAEADIEVIECTWRTSDGSDVALRWLREGRELPDAFICANDEMALGMIGTFEENGVHIPEQVIVTGFDNLTSAELSSPRLSTVNRDYDMLNYTAMEILMDLIDGAPQRNSPDFGFGIVCSESCGCVESARSSTIRDKYFRQTRFLKNFYSQQDEMAGRLFEASDLVGLSNIVENNHGIFGCDNVYLCFNDYYFDNYDKRQWAHDSEFFGREMVLVPCGRRHLAASPGQSCIRFPTGELLPGEMLRRERFLMFYPLHYNTYSIGYLVMDGISEAAKLNLHESIFSFLEIAIENVRKKLLLRQLNDVLDNLYVHDALTQLYNRFGYERFAQPTFERFLASGGAQILFIDMDDMKGINDRLGHELGDAAIRAASEAIRDACNAEDFIMRYGGDEFLVIASTAEKAMEDAIQREVATRNDRGDLPFTLALSVGTIDADEARTQPLDQLVQMADARMYQRKKARKAAR